jgi:gamma-glutamylcyclotransferase (GGCT)/AIG2-like uncharacterized protein YtfP
MPTDLFVYGTLMDETLVQRLTGRRFARLPAVLPEFERLQNAGGYPYVVPRAGARVTGWLLRDVDDASLARLDDYEDEGRLYRRMEVVVHLRAAVGQEPRVARCHTYAGVELP